MRVRNLWLTLLLSVLLCGAAQAADGTMTVTVARADGVTRTAAVSVPDGAYLWCVSFDSGGRMLDAQLVETDSANVPGGAENVKFLTLDERLAPLGPAVHTGLNSQSWEEPYQEGLDALDKEDYGQAVSSFTTAIDMDPEQAPPYVGRGDAYIGLGETEEHLTAAQSDYEQAETLDETNPGAWLGLADVAIRRGDYEKAEEILTEAAEATGNYEDIANKLEEVKSGNVKDSSGNVRRESTFDENDKLLWYHDFTYDENGHTASMTAYNSEGNQTGHIDITYNTDGKQLVNFSYNPDTGELLDIIRNEYDSEGRRTKETYFSYPSNEINMYQLMYYNEQGLRLKTERYNAENSLVNYSVYEYDDLGREVRRNVFLGDHTLDYFQTREYGENGKIYRYRSYSITENGERLDWYYLYFYDEDEKLMRDEHYDGKGNLTRTTLYE